MFYDFEAEDRILSEAENIIEDQFDYLAQEVKEGESHKTDARIFGILGGISTTAFMALEHYKPHGLVAIPHFLLKSTVFVDSSIFFPAAVYSLFKARQIKRQIQ